METELPELAREVDAGFEVGVIVEMIGLLSHYSDVDPELGAVNAAAVRAFFAHRGAPTSNPASSDGRCRALFD